MRLINDDLCDSARVENRSDGSFRAQTKREQTLNLKSKGHATAATPKPCQRLFWYSSGEVMDREG